MKKILLVAVILLASCAPAKKYVWTRPGVTQEEGMKDRFECRTLRDNYYHQAMQSLPPPAPRRAPVYSGPQSAGYGMQDMGDSLSDLGMMSRIKQNAAELLKECMEARGYTLIEEVPVNK